MKYKELAYRLSRDIVTDDFVIDRDDSIAYCRSKSGDIADLLSGTISTTVVANDWCITNLTLTAYSGFRSEALVCIVKMILREVVSENRAKY